MAWNNVIPASLLLYTAEEFDAFRVLAHKGPVANCKGCEAKVQKALRLVGKYFTEQERTNLFIARNHAIDGGEGRREYDRVMAGILDRLNVDSMAVPRLYRRASEPNGKGGKGRKHVK